MQWVESAGVKLHTQCLGDGPPIVMCHGLLTATLATWYFSAAPALARHARVVLYDLRGHGKSTLTTAGYDLDTMAGDLAHIVDATLASAAGEPLTLVGHSYGALIALQYTLQHPQRVSRLVLIDAPLPAAHYVYPSLASIESSDSLQQLLAAVRDGGLVRGERQRRRALERLEFLVLRSSLRDDIRDAGDIPDERLRALTVPTLCLYGKHSDCAAAGQRLARLLPRAELRWLDSDHFIPTRAPAQMTQQLLSYLALATQEGAGHVVHHGIE